MNTRILYFTLAIATAFVGIIEADVVTAVSNGFQIKHKFETELESKIAFETPEKNVRRLVRNPPEQGANAL